jgi:recombination protein RecA
MSQALRKLVGAIKNTDTAMIFTNQLREKIGVMFGSPETTTGGRALKFYASVRIDIRKHASDQGRRGRWSAIACARPRHQEQGLAAISRG